jgi:hypothetical protein
MGYTTNFIGAFKLDKPLTLAHARYLQAFAGSRRMERDPEVAKGYSDPIREAVGLPVGPGGAYFVGGNGFGGQDEDDSIVEYNRPPSGQFSLWCQWVPNELGTEIEWDGNEKFYNYIDWIKYLIEHFLAPWGYVVNGQVEWVGEDRSDTGKIVVRDNKVTTAKGRIVYDDDDEKTHP